MKLRNKCKHEYNMTHSHHYGYTLKCDKCGDIEAYDSRDKSGLLKFYLICFLIAIVALIITKTFGIEI